MNINIGDITITSLETITAFDITTGDYRFTLDELQNATISQSEEKTEITGKQGRKLNSLKRNKAVTISGTNGLISAGLMELQTGNKFESNTETEVMWADYLTVNSGKAVTNFIATGTAGNEIGKLYVKNADGTLGKAYTQDATATVGKFAYNPTSKEITFANEEVADNTEIAVFYKRKISANVLKNLSDKYSEKCSLYIECFGEDTCANVYRVQIYIPKADFNGNFELTMGDNQAVHAFEAEALAGACGTAGSYWTYTVFGANAADVTSGT